MIMNSIQHCIISTHHYEAVSYVETSRRKPYCACPLPDASMPLDRHRILQTVFLHIVTIFGDLILYFKGGNHGYDALFVLYLAGLAGIQYKVIHFICTSLAPYQANFEEVNPDDISFDNDL